MWWWQVHPKRMDLWWWQWLWGHEWWRWEAPLWWVSPVTSSVEWHSGDPYSRASGFGGSDCQANSCLIDGTLLECCNYLFSVGCITPFSFINKAGSSYLRCLSRVSFHGRTIRAVASRCLYLTLALSVMTLGVVNSSSNALSAEVGGWQLHVHGLYPFLLLSHASAMGLGNILLFCRH